MTASAAFIPQPLQASFGDSGPQFAQQAQRLIGRPSVAVVVVVGGQVGLDRTFNLQVVNAIGQPCRGRFPVFVVLALAADGEPSGTQVVEWTTGKVAAEFVADRSYLIYTGDDGTAAVKVSIAGSGTRHLFATALHPADTSGPIAWGGA